DLGLITHQDIRSTSAALTCAYGAPELWENRPTRGTDQYSLAISYYELRTGELPFASDVTHYDLRRIHREGKLDLSRVSEPEQTVLRRATNVHPEERYETCVGFVREMRRALQGPVAPRSPVRPARPDRLPLEPGYELVPGYALREHLFHADMRTDVWSATDPSEKHCSLWIYDLAQLPGTIDLDALRCARQVNHPHLMRVYAWWLLDAAGADISPSFETLGETGPSAAVLVMASEPARINLAHKAQERRESTGEGLPAEQLLPYLRQIAASVEALNMPAHGDRNVRLIHTDVRPANLLVVDNEVKLGNLAWCRLLQGDAARLEGLENRPLRMTLAPEISTGQIDRRSDQFSLAASYVQLRSGKVQLESALPSATTQFLASVDIGLGDLHGEERAVIERAMQSDPAQRFVNCTAMVDELARSVPKRAPVLVPAGPSGDDAYRGTLSEPAADLLQFDKLRADSLPYRPKKARETVENRDATTDPELRESRVAPRGHTLRVALGFGGLLTISLTATAAALFLTAPGQNLLYSVAQLSPRDANPSSDAALQPDSTLSPAVSPTDTPEPEAKPRRRSKPEPAPLLPASPEEEFNRHLSEAEADLLDEDFSGAERELESAQSTLEKLADQGPARLRLDLFQAWVAIG
ncbi:MAG: hypothetical protein ACREFY_00795, partial [Acetobacteraceae bacterium]